MAKTDDDGSDTSPKNWGRWLQQLNPGQFLMLITVVAFAVVAVIGLVVTYNVQLRTPLFDITPEAKEALRDELAKATKGKTESQQITILSDTIQAVLNAASDISEDRPRQTLEAVAGRLEELDFFEFGKHDLIEKLKTLRVDTEMDKKYAAEIRGLLYELKGPFTKPQTFQGADERLAEAIHEIAAVDPHEYWRHPFVKQLWEDAARAGGIFFFEKEEKIEVKIDPGLPRGEARVCMNSKFRDLAVSLLRNFDRPVPMHNSYPALQGITRVRAVEHLDCHPFLRPGQDPDQLFWVSPESAVELLMTDLRDSRFSGIPMTKLTITDVTLHRTLLDVMSGQSSQNPDVPQLIEELLVDLKQR